MMINEKEYVTRCTMIEHLAVADLQDGEDPTDVIKGVILAAALNASEYTRRSSADQLRARADVMRDDLRAMRATVKEYF